MDLEKKGVKLTLRQERMREKDKLKGGIVDSKYVLGRGRVDWM